MASDDLLNRAISLYMSTLKSLDSFISEPAAKYYLSFEQYLILHDIATQKKIMLMDIAEQRQVTRSAISRQIKVLLNHKYVYQRADPNDRRRLFLHLTKEGKRVEAEISQDVTDRFIVSDNRIRIIILSTRPLRQERDQRCANEGGKKKRNW